MNDERLQELKGRAERATVLSEQIAALKEADPHKGPFKCNYTTWDTCERRLSDDLLKEVIAEGRYRLMDMKGKELEGLLGTIQQPDTSTT